MEPSSDGPATYRAAWVDAEVANLRRAPDINRARVKTAQARIAQLRGEQIDVMWRGNWAHGIDAAGGTVG